MVRFIIVVTTAIFVCILNEHFAAADHYDRILAVGQWDAYTLPGSAAGAYVEGRSDDSPTMVFNVGFDADHPGTLYLSLLGPDSLMPDIKAIVTEFDNGDRFKFPSDSLGHVTTMLPEKIPAWIHDFTALTQMTVFLHGIQNDSRPVIFSLAGTTKTITSIAHYASERNVELPEPFSPVPTSRQATLLGTAVLPPSPPVREVGVQEWVGNLEAAQQEIHLAAVLRICGLRDDAWSVRVVQAIKGELRIVTQQVLEPPKSNRTFEQRWSWVSTILSNATVQNVYSSPGSCYWARTEPLASLLDMLAETPLSR